MDQHSHIEETDRWFLDDKDVDLKETRVSYLQLNQAPKFQNDKDPLIEFIELSKPVDADYYLELYQGVGLCHNWVDRLIVSEEDLLKLINRDSVKIFMILHDDDPCGFVEFEHRTHFVEILYFGLLQEYIGRGLGTKCLKRILYIAWEMEPEWIQVNTCDLDSSNAMAIYEKLGFEHYTTRVEMRRTFR